MELEASFESEAMACGGWEARTSGLIAALRQELNHRAELPPEVTQLIAKTHAVLSYLGQQRDHHLRLEKRVACIEESILRVEKHSQELVVNAMERMTERMTEMVRSSSEENKQLFKVRLAEAAAVAGGSAARRKCLRRPLERRRLRRPPGAPNPRLSTDSQIGVRFPAGWPVCPTGS